MKHILWRALVFLLVVLILWAWLNADDVVAEHKARIERHRIERSNGETPAFFLNRTRRVDVREFI